MMILPLIFKFSIAVLVAVAGAESLRGEEPPASDAPRTPADIGTRAAGVDWPRFLGPTFDGKSPETGIRTDWSGGLRVVWTRPLGTGYGIGSVARGRFYQFDRIGNSERLVCLAAETGEPLWERRQPVAYEDYYGYDNGPRSTPTVDGARVYTLGVAGRLSCVAAEDGRLLWSRDLHDEYGVIQNFFGVGCSPVIHDQLVIVMVGGSPPEDASLPPGRPDLATGNGTGIVAFDKRTGREVYRLSDELASYSTPVPTTVDDQPLMLAFMRGGLLAFEPDEGVERWRFPWRSPRAESVNAAVPVLRQNRVMISECYDVGAAVLEFSGDDYRVLWEDDGPARNQAFRAHWATPIEHDGFVYGCSGRNPPDADVRCIRVSDGQVQWNERTRERTSLLYVDDHFVMLGEYGRLQLFPADPERFGPIAELDLTEMTDEADDQPLLRYPCWAAPVLSHGLLYVRGAGRLVCLELIPEE